MRLKIFWEAKVGLFREERERERQAHVSKVRGMKNECEELPFVRIYRETTSLDY